MITVIILSVVIMVLGGGMYILSSRENGMSHADKVGGQAFYFAEGGLENVIDTLNYKATEYQLTQPMPDQSSDNYGYLMNPSPDLRQNPPEADRVQMSIGGQTFSVWVDEIDANGSHCINCGLNLESNNPAYLLITAEGRAPGGYRKLEQKVKLQASGFPKTMFIDGDVNANGTVDLTNQSIYVRGSFYGREKLGITGTDQVFGGPAALFATGSIYAKQNGNNSQIYTSSGGQSPQYWSNNYINDRDSRGPSANTFSLAELEDTFSSGGLTTSQLLTLKGMAKTNGYYSNPSSGQITLQQGDIPNHNGNIVIYIEYSGGSPDTNQVNIKFEWPHDPYTTGQAWVVVRNGSVMLEGNQMGSFHGTVYCPDGPAKVNGNGSGSFTGTLWGKGLTDIGNFNFTMDAEYFNDPPFFAWTVVRQPDWVEVDR